METQNSITVANMTLEQIMNAITENIMSEAGPIDQYELEGDIYLKVKGKSNENDGPALATVTFNEEYDNLMLEINVYDRKDKRYNMVSLTTWTQQEAGLKANIERLCSPLSV